MRCQLRHDLVELPMAASPVKTISAMAALKFSQTTSPTSQLSIV